MRPAPARLAASWHRATDSCYTSASSSLPAACPCLAALCQHFLFCRQIFRSFACLAHVLLLPSAAALPFSHFLAPLRPPPPVCRAKHQSRGAVYEQILNKNEQMYALLAVVTALCPTANRNLDEAVANTLREK